MKKVLLIVSALVLYAFSMQAQVYTDIKFTSKKGFSSVKKDVEFVIDSVTYNPFYTKFVTGPSQYDPTYVVNVTQSGKSSSFVAGSLPKELDFIAAEDNLDNYWFVRNLESLRTISEIKDLYKTRAELEKDSNEYLKVLSKYNLLFDDPYLESYLYSVVSKILPYKRADGFPYDLKIKIVKDPSANAAAYPNGILLVNTGLLALVHSEDELAAILAHEVAHFVANHSLVNLRKMEKAQDRAAALSLLTIGLAGIASAATIPYGYYDSSGSLLKSTALLSYVAASQYLEKMGMEYTKEQEKDADLMAVAALNYLGYDKNALATVFQRMADNFVEEGNWAAYYISGNHPSLQNRIEYSGIPRMKADSKFEKIVSFAITQTGMSKYNDGRFKQALKLANQNINNSVGTDDDYLIKALCLLNLYSDDAHNREALDMVQKAKAIYAGNANILRTEIIAFLRLNETNKAKALLETYSNQIINSMDKEPNKDGPYYSFLIEEMEWVRNMTVKVRGM